MKILVSLRRIEMEMNHLSINEHKFLSNSKGEKYKIFKLLIIIRNLKNSVFFIFEVIFFLHFEENSVL